MTKEIAMTVTVFLASMIAVAIAAMLIMVLTSGGGGARPASRPVRSRSDTDRRYR